MGDLHQRLVAIGEQLAVTSVYDRVANLRTRRLIALERRSVRGGVLRVTALGNQLIDRLRAEFDRNDFERRG